MPAAAVTYSRKVAVDFPESLLRESEAVAAELQTNRSGFIRMAVENFLAERRHRRLCEDLAAGYAANAAIARKIAEDFSCADPEFV